MSRRSNKSARRSAYVAPTKLAMQDNKTVALPNGRHTKTVTVSKDYNKNINTSISAIPSAKILGLSVYSRQVDSRYWKRGNGSA